MLSSAFALCRLSHVSRFRLYRQSLATFNTKGANDGNYRAKKKKAIGAQQSFGTPKTGLILNSDVTLHNTTTFVQEKQRSPKFDQGDIFSPLLDQTNPTITLPTIPQNNIYSMNSSIDLDLSSSNNSSLLDVSSMYDEKIHLPLKPDFSDPKQNYEPATPLGDELMKYIGVMGSPITVAEYMRRCLRDEKFGYYTNPPKGGDDFDGTEGRGHRLIGQAGDFTTAPEISQIFGECLTIWLLTQYEALGKPSKIQLVELGPGRGTLMCDILRSAKNVEGSGERFINALVGDTDMHSGVHFVEVSENLRTTQREALEALMVKENIGSGINFEFTKWATKAEQARKVESLVSKLREKKNLGETIDEEYLANMFAKEKNAARTSKTTNVSDEGRIPVYWHDNFDFIPYNEESPVPTFIIAQEFMDALPVHVFQKHEGVWREHMVDVVIQEDDDSQSKVQVQMRDGTIATTNSNSRKQTNKFKPGKEKIKRARFRKVLSPGVTPALKSLLRANDDGHVLELDHVPDGSIMEVCPEALSLVQDIALRIEKCHGAALIIDYGEEGSRDSLRAFKRHTQVDIMSSPGAVDITADVDFTALRNAVNRDMLRNMKDKESIVEAFGPKSQGEFLAAMGAVERTINLIEDEKTTDEQAEELCSALERLVAENEMGQKFKVLSIARRGRGIPPSGF